MGKVIRPKIKIKNHQEKIKVRSDNMVDYLIKKTKLKMVWIK